MTFSLATQPIVELGPLRLLPPTREILDAHGRCHVVEPRMMQVLLALIRADGAIVSRDALNASCWEGRIVGEDAINRVISRLRRLEADVGGVFRIETVTRVGYRLIVTSPEMLIHSDAARLAPDPSAGDAPDPDGKASAPAAEPSASRRRAGYWVLVAATIAALLAASLWIGSKSSRAGKLGAELQISELTPLSPDVPPRLPTIAREEMVAAFGRTSLVQIATAPSPAGPDPLVWQLTGSIDRVGAQLRFILHLTHRSTGKVIWSVAIDRPAAAPGAAAKSVAAAVEQVIDTGLVAAAGYRGGNLPDATLALLLQFNEDTTLPAGPYRHAEEVLRRAVAQTPDFGPAWSALALALGYTATASEDPAAMRAARAAAPAVIAAALKYQPGDALALLARAKTVPLADFALRDAAYRAAVSAPMSAVGSEHSAYSVFLINVGQVLAAVREAKIGHDLDPLNSLFMARYATALSLAGQTEAADRIVDEALLIWPGDGPSLELKARSALWTRQFDRGLAALAANQQLPPATRSTMAAALTALRDGDPRARLKAGDALLALSNGAATNSAFVVSALGALGRPDDALAAARRLVDTRNAAAAAVLFDPSLADARRLPAFTTLVDRIGLRAYWRQSGRMPDFCTTGIPAPMPLCAVAIAAR